MEIPSVRASHETLKLLNTAVRPGFTVVKSVANILQDVRTRRENKKLDTRVSEVADFALDGLIREYFNLGEVDDFELDGLIEERSEFREVAGFICTLYDCPPPKGVEVEDFRNKVGELAAQRFKEIIEAGRQKHEKDFWERPPLPLNISYDPGLTAELSQFAREHGGSSRPVHELGFSVDREPVSQV